MTFTEKLIRLTADQNKSKLSEAAGLRPMAITTYIHRGQMPAADVALRLARTLRVPFEWLIDDSKGWPPSLDLSSVPDDVFMDEACRRLAEQAKRVSFDLARIKLQNWSEVADELLAIPVTAEISAEQERMGFLLSLLYGAMRHLREFDATAAIKSRKLNYPDLDDLEYEIEALLGMPEFKTLPAYFDLRHIADYLKRNDATQLDWDTRDVEGQRKRLIAQLSRLRDAGRKKFEKP